MSKFEPRSSGLEPRWLKLIADGSLVAAGFAVLTFTVAASGVSAQEAEASADTETDAGEGTAEATVTVQADAPAAEATVEAESGPAPEAQEEPDDAPAQSEPEHVIEEAHAMAEEEAEEESVAEEGSEERPWTDNLTVSAFVDAYLGIHWNLPRSFGQQDLANSYLAHRAYDTIGGATVAFAGLDASYSEGNVGATINLRFGSAVPRLLIGYRPPGTDFLKQAYVTWAPTDNFHIDFGEFDTIYGAEVSESWLNLNYSRGSLYNLIQPFYHTGFRLEWSPVSEFTVRALAVNGWNDVLDQNAGKSLGIQFLYTGENVMMALGYLGGPERWQSSFETGDADAHLRHFVDYVLTISAGDLSVVFNADLYIDDTTMPGMEQSQDTLGGISLAAAYQFIPEFATALRGELIGYENAGEMLGNLTLTLDWKPDEHIVIRLDNKVEFANGEAPLGGFLPGQSWPVNDLTPGQYNDVIVSTLLGVVAHTN